MRILTILALSAMSFSTAAPVFAQDTMMKDGMHSGAMAHMSAADTRRMNSCKAMSHDAMMRNASCRRMAQMHPDMMHHDNMMKHDGAMAHDNMMKSGH
ncbi:hypothetical protein KRR38_03605 [Novosphingobium sp. G106]|uniref:hypothetical protein n=1 Tax=Novosphingobium sp. G106 TaxID=2849500 RepID=UPI001C2DB809|nr:hypothetical protein [Novosphingobium sp. G106]MBV1686780.1 hypothetical protein [Novosphingobium sp. G106]